MSNNFAEMIKFEIGSIDDLIQHYSVLINLSKIKELDNIEIAAMATVLHSFYTGVERAFLLINKNVDKNILQGNRWHIELLTNMTNNNDTRDVVISKNVFNMLHQYMAFRHYFRHAYSFQLEWLKMKPLIDELLETWKLTKNELLKFLNTHSKVER